MQVANRTPDEHIHVRITDGQGHWIRMAVVGATKRIRFEVAGPGGTVVLRGDLDASFESQLDLLREHGTDAKVGIAGRFQIVAVDESDQPGYVDWGNGGPTVWVYPNRRGPATDWARFPMDEVLADLQAVWECHRTASA